MNSSALLLFFSLSLTFFFSFSFQDAERLKQLVRSIINSHKLGCHDNVAKVLLHPSESLLDGQTGEEEEEEGLTEQEKEEKRVIKALEMKYDALRDKLIIEVTDFVIVCCSAFYVCMNFIYVC